MLEGLYLKCGLATDIFLFDSYPSSYNTYMSRSCRWIRGDWQIIKWLNKKIKNKKENNIQNPLGELDKFKIIDNIRRSLLEISQILGLLFFGERIYLTDTTGSLMILGFQIYNIIPFIT